MCGIAGFVARNDWSTETADAMLRRMAAAIERRGPDDEGFWFDEKSRLGLAHRRLAIQDLSDNGHQPMVSRCGRFVLIFNGEIYNFRRIRRELERAGETFRGYSDTEVFLAAVCRWGIRAAVERSYGMFAIALYDRREQKLWLIRDRVGEKPLYFGSSNGIFLFASVLTAMEALPDFERRINPDAVAALLQQKCIPAPLSIYQGISKLEPGCIASVSLGSHPPKIDYERYWTHPHARPGATTSESEGRASESQLEAELENVLSEQMLADRPVGAFLSGGIDSPLIVSLLQRIASKPVRTFTVGFEESDFDEARDARRIARHLGTDHTEVFLPANTSLEVIPEISSCFDEPFADSSQIPTMLISSVARRDVTVVLSGDGGDEVFGGYDRYSRAIRKWRSVSRVPASIRLPIAGLCRIFDNEFADRMLSPALWAASPRRRGRSAAALFRHAAGLLASHDIRSIYTAMLNDWHDVTKVVPAATAFSPLATTGPGAAGEDERQYLMACDFRDYLPNDVLVKVDRASMYYSLETRAPLLDVRIVELAAKFDSQDLYRDDHGKAVLRSLLSKHLPAEFMAQSKRGFAVPLGSWLTGSLRDWTEERLSIDSLGALNCIEVEPVREKWRQHREGIWDNAHALWSVLMLVEWMRSRESSCSRV